MTTPKDTQYHRLAMIVIIGLLLLRLAGLIASPQGLHGDEAQYWAWSKDLDWGYFTKPPMIAWVIFSTTSIFGDTEWAVRLASPLLHAITACVIFASARFAYDARTGFWAVIFYLLMPALTLSSGIVTTDVPLLLCWAVALNAWLHLRDNPTWPRAVQLGVAFGLGMLAKYAMLFFVPALIMAFILDPPTRQALRGFKGYAAGALALLIITPNILWNINNDFATLSHTAANANLKKEIPFHPIELLTFWIDQLGVFGPITLVLMGLAVIAAMKKQLDPPSFFIAGFVISPLLIISVEALLSRANANWAVTAYVAAPILLAHFCVKSWPRLAAWVKAGLGLNIIFAVILSLAGLLPSFANAIGAANSFKHVRAWPETVEIMQEKIAEGHQGKAYTMIAADKRMIFYDLNYYGLGQTLPLKMWMYKSAPQDHAELTHPLPAQAGPVFIINYYDNYEDVLREDFERLVPLEPFDIDLGGGKRRKLKLWAGYGYTPTPTR